MAGPGYQPLGIPLEPPARYWTGFDVTANALGYAPLGFLLALSFLRRGSHRLRAHQPHGCDRRAPSSPPPCCR